MVRTTFGFATPVIFGFVDSTTGGVESEASGAAARSTVVIKAASGEATRDAATAGSVAVDGTLGSAVSASNEAIRAEGELAGVGLAIEVGRSTMLAAADAVGSGKTLAASEVELAD